MNGYDITPSPKGAKPAVPIALDERSKWVQMERFDPKESTMTYREWFDSQYMLRPADADART